MPFTTRFGWQLAASLLTELLDFISSLLLNALTILRPGSLEPWDFERLADTNAAGEATRCLDDDDDDEAALTGTAGRRPRLLRDDAEAGALLCDGAEAMGAGDLGLHGAIDAAARR